MYLHFTRKALRLVASLYVLCAGSALAQSADIALRQMVLPSEQQAREVRARVLAGDSFDSSYLGRMRRSDLRPEVQAALSRVAPGGVTEPVHVDGAYFLFQIVPESEARWIELDEGGARALADGRNAEAIRQFEQALSQAESAELGFTALARSLDSLASAYRIEGRDSEAEKLYRRALGLLDGKKGLQLEVAQVITGLGMALVKQGRFADAEPLYERARSIREESLGPDHPEVAATVHNLADVAAGRKRFVHAASLYEQSQAMLRNSLGPDHPATLAGAQRVQVFRRSLMPELLDRFSTLVALSEFRDREFDRTVTEIRELLPLSPLSERSYVQMKDILLEVGLSTETEHVLQAGLEKFPDSRLLRVYMADLLSGTGRTQNALAILEEAGRLPRPAGLDVATDNQQLGIIHQRIGDLRAALTDFDGAVAAYKQSLEFDPMSPKGWIKLGKACFSSNRLDEAQIHFERAVRETPTDNEAYLNLAEAHLAGGGWEPAAKAARQAIDLGASDSRALYLLGTALVRMGLREEGQMQLREFAKVEAGFQELEHRNREIEAINVASIRSFREGKGSAAIRQLTEAVAAYPDAARLRMNLAGVLSRLGEHEMAVETLESMLERKIGRRFLIHKVLAEEYQTLGNMAAARRHRETYLDTREAELIVYGSG